MGNNKVDKRNDNDETPLMFASYYGDRIGVETLVRQGADVNAYNKDRFTVLMFALDKEEIVKYLLNNGIRIDNIFFKNHNGENILDLMKKNNQSLTYLKLFLESQLSLMGYYTEKSLDFLKRWSADENEIINFYINVHKKFVVLNSYHNLIYLIKQAPTFGHSFTLFTSDRYTILDEKSISELKKGNAVYYPRILKCTWHKPLLNLLDTNTKPLYLSVVVTDKYLFSDELNVFIAPRYMTVFKIVETNNYTVLNVA